MSFQKFPDYMYEILCTGGNVELGTFTIDDSGELTNSYATMIFYRTDLFTTEQIRLRYDRSNAPSIPVYSDWITPANITGFTSTNYWIGNVRFDFNNEAVKAASTVNLYLETSGYTHDHSGTQIGSIMNYIDTATGAFDVVATRPSFNNLFINR